MFSHLLLAASILASLAGIFGFIVLFIFDYNIYWFILTPIIFPLYQAPAAYLFWLWKKGKK